MHDLTAAEIRVLGCLVEKESTTPDNYPLTLNSLRLACNQSSSRDPVVDYDEHTIEQALRSLRERGLTRTVHSTSNRGAKYRHVLPDELGLGPAELAALAVLLLRGPQTVGEVKGRTGRMRAFGSTDEVEMVLDTLAGRGLAARLERQPGQKDVRWVHLLGDAAPPPAPPPATEPDTPAFAPVVVGDATVRPFVEADRAAVIDLWTRCDLTRPWNDPSHDIDRRLAVGGVGGLLVAVRHGRIVGTVMVGDDGHRGWMNYLAVDPGARRAGVGRILVAIAEGVLRDAGCPKVNVQVREEHLAAADFYESIGYEVDAVVGMGKRLTAD